MSRESLFLATTEQLHTADSSLNGNHAQTGMYPWCLQIHCLQILKLHSFNSQSITPPNPHAHTSHAKVESSDIGQLPQECTHVHVVESSDIGQLPQDVCTTKWFRLSRLYVVKSVAPCMLIFFRHKFNDYSSLILRPFTSPVFDLQYANMEGEDLEDLVTCGDLR